MRKSPASTSTPRQMFTRSRFWPSTVSVVKKLAAACTGFNPISCCPPCFSDMAQMPTGTMLCFTTCCSMILHLRASVCFAQACVCSCLYRSTMCFKCDVISKHMNRRYHAWLLVCKLCCV